MGNCNCYFAARRTGISSICISRGHSNTEFDKTKTNVKPSFVGGSFFDFLGKPVENIRLIYSNFKVPYEQFVVFLLTEKLILEILQIWEENKRNKFEFWINLIGTYRFDPKFQNTLIPKGHTGNISKFEIKHQPPSRCWYVTKKNIRVIRV